MSSTIAHPRHYADNAPVLPRRSVRAWHPAAFLATFLLCILFTAGIVRAQESRPAPTTGPLTPVQLVDPAGLRQIQGLTIQRVEVVGNTRTDTRVILDQVRRQEGQPFDYHQVDVDGQSVAALDRFVTVITELEPVENAQTHQLTGVIVRFKVEERPIITSVEIVGNRKFTDADIRAGLLDRAGAAVDLFKIETDKKYILEMYRKKGYTLTVVDVDEALRIRQNIIRFNITEGPPSRISEVRFDGNHNIKTSVLKSKVQTKPYLWIFRKGLLEEDKLQVDLYAIQTEYHKRGFIDARVGYLLEYSEDKSKIIVRFEIIEGPRYRIAAIKLAGNKIFSTEELLLGSRLTPGAFAEQDRIDALQKRIQDFYGHQGYIYANVDVGRTYTQQEDTIDLNFNITEGLPYTVGRIIIRGNAKIQDRVIRRQIRIYPDQIFDMVLVQKSIDRLKALGGKTKLFPNVKVTGIAPDGNPEGVRDALVEVQEGQTGSFSFGAGVSTNSGLIGQFSLEQQNFDITNMPNSLGEFLTGQSFRGAGQFFQILLEPGTELQQYRLKFEEPYLLDSPYSFGNDIYYFTRRRESWDERRIGDLVTLGRRFGDIWAVTLALRFEQVNINGYQDANHNYITDTSYFLTNSNGQFTGPFNDSAQEVIDGRGSHFITSIKPGVGRDTTDSRIFPTTGSRAAISWEQYGAFGGTATFSKIIVNFDWFHTLYTDLLDRKTVLSLRNEVDIIPLGESPFYERFYMGGIGNLRGFKYRGVSPRSGPLNDPIGGDWAWFTTAEVNYPIYEELLRGVIFVDVGTCEPTVGLSAVRLDFGAGIRVKLPIFAGVPLAVDLAFPVMKQAHDETQIFSVFLGVPFS